MCVGAVEGSFLGSPIGLITLVLTEGNTYLYFTASPLLFGEILTHFTSSSGGDGYGDGNGGEWGLWMKKMMMMMKMI